MVSERDRDLIEKAIEVLLPNQSLDRSCKRHAVDLQIYISRETCYNPFEGSED